MNSNIQKVINYQLIWRLSCLLLTMKLVDAASIPSRRRQKLEKNWCTGEHVEQLCVYLFKHVFPFSSAHMKGLDNWNQKNTYLYVHLYYF